MFFFFFKQKTAYEMRISDWSSDVCSSDLPGMKRHREREAARKDRGAPGTDRRRSRPRLNRPSSSQRRGKLWTARCRDDAQRKRKRRPPCTAAVLDRKSVV